MRPINVINKLNESEVSKVSEIEIYGDDFQFADKLEDLGYEYMLSLYSNQTGDYSITIYKETSGNEDFIVIRTDDNANMTKVDHNGESLFFTQDEYEMLRQDND